MDSSKKSDDFEEESKNV